MSILMKHSKQDITEIIFKMLKQAYVMEDVIPHVSHVIIHLTFTVII